ncbi:MULTISPECIES: bacteriohemerythrin [Thauera]|jgi:hemerythrin|uniref:Hemerythrin-like metal-binding protein n=1 Tax=Thauera aminoaromatica TaxID=164330 RepID=C4ZPH6_THASP|nr:MULTISPECIES: hemerythrin domain-containing protein [Thauera]ACK54822.1 hemerythrin-like metal-binding protein [Thauera aminoaromatica]ENO79140.1 hemerythrin-like metal-binding protein [Thauera sp. 63]
MTEAHPGFDWTDRYSLGYTSMDDTHREFVTLVDALLTAPDAGLAQALDAFAAHAVAHFEQEDGWMRGTDFPAADCHIDEHAKVLASVREVQQELAAGNAVLVRELAQALMDWFPGHADYMDSALAQWMVKRSHGGAPLVFRRDSAKA